MYLEKEFCICYTMHAQLKSVSMGNQDKSP